MFMFISLDINRIHSIQCNRFAQQQKKGVDNYGIYIEMETFSLRAH